VLIKEEIATIPYQFMDNSLRHSGGGRLIRKCDGVKIYYNWKLDDVSALMHAKESRKYLVTSADPSFGRRNPRNYVLGARVSSELGFILFLDRTFVLVFRISNRLLQWRLSRK
jgi:hypothetical protein